MRSNKDLNTAVKLYQYTMARTGGDPDAIDEVLHNLAVLWVERQRPGIEQTEELAELLVRLSRLQRRFRPRVPPGRAAALHALV